MQTGYSRDLSIHWRYRSPFNLLFSQDMPKFLGSGFVIRPDNNVG